MAKQLLVKDMRSDGSTQHYVMPELYNYDTWGGFGGPIPVTIPAGEQVRILIGAELLVRSWVDDMVAQVDASLSWILQDVVVKVLDGP